MTSQQDMDFGDFMLYLEENHGVTPEKLITGVSGAFLALCWETAWEKSRVEENKRIVGGVSSLKSICRYCEEHQGGGCPSPCPTGHVATEEDPDE